MSDPDAAPDGSRRPEPRWAFWTDLPPTTRGLVVMIASTMLFSIMHACIRHLGQQMPPAQMVFFRNFFGLVVFLPFVVRSGFGFLATSRFSLHLLRSVLNLGGMMANFFGLSLTPLARATAITFATPIFVAVLSVVVLGERLHVRRWIAVAVGFLGMLVILRPGLVAIDAGSLLLIVSAALWALVLIDVKVLSRTDSSLTITGYMNLLLSALSLAPALWVWQTPTLEQWGWLAAIGVIGTLAQLLMAEALRQADASAVMPFDFLRLLWATLIGVAVFSERPDLFTWIGAAIVFGSGVYLAFRESLARRESGR